MRKRYSLSFNLEVERHKRAYELLKERPAKQQSEFIVSCILAAQEKTEVKDAIYDAVCRALDSKGTAMAIAPQEPTFEDGVIPENMMAFLSRLQE